MRPVVRSPFAAVSAGRAPAALLLGIGAAALLSACESTEAAPSLELEDSGGSEAEPAVFPEDGGQAALPDEVLEALAGVGEVEVLLELDEIELTAPEVAGVLAELDLDAAALPGLEPAEREGVEAALREARAGLFDDVVDRLIGRLPAEAELGRRYRHVPMVMVRVSRLEALQALAADPLVRVIHPQRVYEPFLTQSLDLINQPEAAAAGHTGAGVAVAVLDTGLDYTRAAFGSCSAPGAGGACRVVAARDFAPADGVVDSGSFHGTNVAGIVAGVAPGASLIGLDVFRADGGGYTSDIVAAIDWVIANKAVYNIAAMNLSLGGGSFTALCPSDAFEVALGSAKAAGVAAAVATGNNAYTNRVASPACAPSAIRVGAVYDSNMGGVGWSGCSDASTAADKVTCFSNSASFVDLLAPGALITAAGITQGGTSQATPHVAGALAVMRGAFPSDEIDDHVDRLKSTGRNVLDTRNGYSFPRIDVEAAVAGAGLDCSVTLSGAPSTVSAGSGTTTVSVDVQAGCPWAARTDANWLVASPAVGTGPGTFTLTRSSNGGASRTAALTVGDATASVVQAANDVPTVSLSINGGQAYTGSRSVNLSVGATDSGTVTHMCLSTSTSCSWVPFAASPAYTLASRDGVKLLRVRVKDEHGATSDWAEARITLDSVAPVLGQLRVVPGAGEAQVQWSGFSDAASGLSSVRVVWAEGAVTPDCASGNALTGSGSGSGTATGLTDGLAYSFRACAVDNVGNRSFSPVAYAVPVGAGGEGAKLSINAGAAVTNNRSVTLTLTPPSDATQYCASNTAACTRFLTVAPTVRWSLLATQGTSTVMVWYKTAAGVVSGPFGDSVLLDTVRPTDGTVAVGRADGAIDLSWSGFADAVSGIDRYRVYSQATSAPACGRGTLAYEGPATTARISGLTNGAPVGVRVCAVDVAGNVSTGASVVTSAASEGVAPTGTVEIVSAGDYVKGRAVDLRLQATDPSGVTQMCVSNTTTCTSFRTYGETLRWTLAGANGPQTVYVRYKDGNGNISSPVTDTILTDSLGPTGGTLSATAGAGSVTIGWSGFVDAGAGLSEARLRYAQGTRAPSCTTGIDAGSSNGSSLVVTGLSSATAYSFRLCPVDAVGNVGAGLATTVTAL